MQRLLKIILALLILAIIIISIFYIINLPHPSFNEETEINALVPPVQIDSTNIQPVFLRKRGMDFVAYPQAYYKVAAVIKGRENYYFDSGAKLAPVDLALAWGMLSMPEYDKWMVCHQNSRRYYFYAKANSALNKELVYPNSANTHIIPASVNILRAINTLDRGDKIELEGYLVNILHVEKNGRRYEWNSSLSRDDVGDGACELMYVKRIKIGKKVYL